jgi:predicted ATPase
MSRVRRLQERVLVRGAMCAGAVTLLVALTEAGKKWA